MRLLSAGFAVIAALASQPALAQTLALVGAGNQIGLLVGSTGGTVDTVNFNFSSQPVGTAVPQSGAAIPIEIALFSKGGAASAARVVSLTASPAVASASGLTSGANVVPWTEISWTVASIVSSVGTTTVIGPAAGSFPATGPTTTLISLQCTTPSTYCYVHADYTFSYKNTNVVPAGTYTGVIVYTVSML
ncbi:MAG: hypothetical protein OEW21_06980 [Betaproteobacteria bacterium]|nr:hypothetical protein [Betaproteobacteria bacterium]